MYNIIRRLLLIPLSAVSTHNLNISLHQLLLISNAQVVYRQLAQLIYVVYSNHLRSFAFAHFVKSCTQVTTATAHV